MRNLMRSVDQIADPHLTEEFTCELNPVQLSNIMASLKTTAMLWLDNALCIAMERAVDQFRNVVEITRHQIDDLDVFGKLIICDPMNAKGLAERGAYYLTSNNARVDDKILVINKSDNTHLLDYTYEVFQPEPTQVGIRLKVKFHLDDCISGVQYTINNGYDQCSQ